MHARADTPPPKATDLLGPTSAAALVAGATVCVQLPALLAVPACWAGVLGGVGAWAWPWRGRWLGALLVGLCWASLHGHWVLQRQLPEATAPLDAVVSGRVVDLPDHQPHGTRFLFDIDDGPGIHSDLRGRRVQVHWNAPFARRAQATSTPAAAPTTPRRHAIAGGARWRLSLRLKPPRSRINPGGFDGERHAVLHGIAATASVRGDASARELAPARGIAAWRETMAIRIQADVAPAQSPFVRALALGDTRALRDADWEQLRALGLTHLIAISGFHVGLAAGAVALLVSGVWRCLPVLPLWWPRPQAAALAAALGACGYAVVAGLALPTVRTALMIVVVALARCTRRRMPWGQSLALAALSMLAVAPLSVLSAGFWLSFGGVLWLLWCLPGGGVAAGGWKGVLKPFLAAQAVASVALLPLGVNLFGQASRIGPLVNLPIVPWWSLVVVPLALLGTALEALHAGAGRWLWQLAGATFALSWRWLQPLAAWDGAVWWLPEAPRWALPLALLGVFWWLLPRGRGGLLAAPLLCLPLLWPDRQRPPAGTVELVVMDVGQGTALLVRTRDHALLYDVGPGGVATDSGTRIVVPTLRALGVGLPQRVMLSHGDADHAGGLPGVRAAWPAVPIWAPADAGIEGALPCQRGQQWQWDGVEFSVLYPLPGPSLRGNENSCVLRVGTAHGALLLAGDIGHPAEALMLRSTERAETRELQAAAVLVPHHGSAGSSSAEWVAAVSPQLALVSAGHRNRFRHPRPEVVSRWQAQGAEVVGTAGSGALRVWLGPQGLGLREQRQHLRRWWDAAGRGRAAAILLADKQMAPGPEG